MISFPKIAIAGVVGFVAACANEAGIGPENASFGEAYTNNGLVQSAEYRRGDYLMEVRAAFAEETPDTINFAFDRANLDRQARRALDRQASWLRANPDVRVRVFGHTDLVGGESYNNRLGLRRARAAARYLQRKGVARGRIDAVESQGESQPLVQTEERERRNRRTVTEVAGFTHGFVGEGMDGRRALLMYRRYQTDTVEKPSTSGTVEGIGE